jgi:uncharacterized membrane protein YeaQ/YmgE (transglycosylase-associated protein family)
MGVGALLAWLLIGAIAGWLAGELTRGHGFGLVGNIIIGILGAVVGGWLAGALGLGDGGTIWTILVATIGAIIVLFIASLVAGRRPVP